MLFVCFSRPSKEKRFEAFAGFLPTKAERSFTLRW